VPDGWREGTRAPDGIRIGVPGEGECWWVPGPNSSRLAELPSAAGATAGHTAGVDCRRKAVCIRFLPPRPGSDKPGRWLSTKQRSPRAVRVIAEQPVPLRDIQWSPDGRLGLVRGGEKPTLHFMGSDGRLSRP
jgi:hypothetical protein